VNRPFATGFGAGGAVTVRPPTQSHRRRYRNRRCTIRISFTRQSICSPVSEPRNSNANPQAAQHRNPSATSWTTSSVSRYE